MKTKPLLTYFATLALILLSATAFGSEPKKIFAAKIVDSTGQEAIVTNLHSFADGSKADETFLEVKRGEANLDIGFEKIKAIVFLEDEGKAIEDHRLAELTMTSGKVIKGYVERDYLEGSDEDTGSEFGIAITKISRIDFLHDGTFTQCPLCNAIFYNSRATSCTFDKERLKKR